jgi:hypothetical protein
VQELNTPRRVRCVYPSGMPLTEGKDYDVLDSDTDAMIRYYKLRDDHGDYVWISGEYLTPTPEVEPCKN